MVGRSISYQERALMLADLNSGETFAAVAKKHRVSETQAVSVFDAAYPEIARKPLPRILLIDEFKFRTEYSKYCCHLVDFERSETVDVVRSRQKAYLDEYFGRIGEEERRKVKIVVTDMYDEYAALAAKWLPNAQVIVDRFHVVKQLTEAVNRLRVIAMGKNEHDRLAYSFMKSKWRLFLMRKKDIPDKFYVRKSDGCQWHFDDLVRHCLSLDADLANAYDCLQDLFHYTKTQDTFENAVKGIDFVAGKLENCRCPILLKVASTYRKWKVGIARGLAKNDFGAVLTNGRMEAANNVAQTLIDAAYGYRNFERFRKRFLLIRWNKK